MKFQFVEEKEGYTARIKVVGVGGAGGNAINNMIAASSGSGILLGQHGHSVSGAVDLLPQDPARRIGHQGPGRRR